MSLAEADALGVRLLYSPHRPEPPQHAFLWLNTLEALYGGAAGGGKSDALLMAAMQYVDVPGYAALLLRRTYQDLSLPGALMDRAHAWLASTDARWSGDTFRWTFPSGASLSFGYLQTSVHRYRYASAEFQFIGFDELTQFPEADYRFLFSRLRRPSDLDPDNALARVPLRMRAASNPGGQGHEWVLRRYIERTPDPDDPDDTPERARRRVFIPAKLDDNPHVDAESYRAALRSMTVLERKRLEEGDWYADEGDRIYPAAGIDAALNLGALLERDPPPPAGGLLSMGLDFGEHTAYVVGWPLEAGGLWIIAADMLVGSEPGDATHRILAALGDAAEERGIRQDEVLDALSDVRFDAAGVQSMRTFAKIARRRRPLLRTTRIPFGNYKREAIGYAKHLLERSAEGHDTRVLAISPSCRLFARQLRALAKDPKDPELPLKPAVDARNEDRDDIPDALLALVAPLARRNRAR